MIEMKGICKTYRGAKTVPVLRDFSMSLGAGETIALMGKSGSGKSTVAKILLFLENADAGEIWYNGEMLTRDRRTHRQFRRHVQYISQHPESFFDPARKLSDSVMEAAHIHSIPRKEAQTRLEELLEQTKINRAVLDRYPYQVSGGEIQRVAICRALLLRPAFMVLDEATSMLDVSVQAQVLNILKDLQRKDGLGYLFISHEEDVVEWFTDGVPGKLIRIHNGRGSAV